MKSKNKFFYLDLLRGWAMVIMVEVHVFNAFLRPEIKKETWFSVLNFINGMVAPSFVFIAGFAFILSSKNNINELRNYGNLFRKKLGRIGLIFFVGYLLHIPYFSMRNNFLYTDPGLLKSFYNVDVLQCIGAGILMLFISRLIIKSDRIYNTFIILSLIGFVMGAPFIWNIDFNRFLPLPVACYFNEVHGSYFPVFPWLGFLFSGAVVATFLLKARAKGVEDKFMNRLILAGIFFIIITFPLVAWLESFSWFEVKPSPLFFIQRLGVIFILLYLFRLYYKKRGERESFFLDMSRESLLVYWLHLQIIYRILFNGRSIDNMVNKSFGVIECTAATSALLILMIVVAITWGKIKKNHPEWGRKIFAAVLIGGMIIFSIT
ncbi:MAG TPA: heparan-alpha-glucosaminide N-acetyltransferase domain-containing protein [Spirochaetota bacterium]|nr:heparan-alpha-glucosaminide N-acetyltransferase domain-containing protein [Spirochaetota bacterium]HPS87315.1 heparan-alpha-glucosaminide N-acetyltransferase domain-containing protein [Spirochaetota bacterium]